MADIFGHSFVFNIRDFVEFVVELTAVESLLDVSVSCLFLLSSHSQCSVYLHVQVSHFKLLYKLQHCAAAAALKRDADMV